MGIDKPMRNSEPKKYIVVESLISPSDLEGGVNYRMGEGYQPIGGMSVVSLTDGKGVINVYYQAMVRNG